MSQFQSHASLPFVRKLLIATSNGHKFAEIRSMLTLTGFDVLGLDEEERPPPPPETGSTFGENARIKASYYRAKTGYPTLADDSGLQVDALGGAPGVNSSRWAPTDEQRMARILDQLSHFCHSNDLPRRSARFVCAACLDWEGGVILETRSVEGEIALQPAGDGGFGYDPIFYYPPLQRTFGQLTSTQKNEVSHRTRALARVKRRLMMLSELTL